MKTTSITLFLNFLFVSVAVAQSIPPDSLYLGQTLPCITPLVFNLSVNTGSFAAERIAISNDGKEIYYSEVHNYYPAAGDTIKYYKYSGGNWTGPFNLFPGYLAPALSVNSDTMYFQNDTIQNNNIVYQTFFSVRNETGWGNPQRVLANLNSAHYLQVTNNGHYYISSISNAGNGAADWCRLFVNGTDTTAISLGLPLNTAGDNLDFFISRDETYMIVAKPKPAGLSVSYHKDDDNWTNPKSLGTQINFGPGAWGPYVSSGNKYLFYTTGTQPDYSDTYVYWVRIDSLIDSLRYTNFIPYVKNRIPDYSAIKGELFAYTIPDSTFIDDDGNNTLTYHAKLTNGSPLPAWLTFDTIAGTFSGIPAITGTLNIRLTATDPAGAAVSTNMKIIVNPHVSTDQLHGQREGFIIFPNPTSGLLNICSDAFSGKPATVEIRNQEGKLIQLKSFENTTPIDITGEPGGIYILKLFNEREIFVSKVVLNN